MVRYFLFLETLPRRRGSQGLAQGQQYLAQRERTWYDRIEIEIEISTAVYMPLRGTRYGTMRHVAAAII
jgi:hypothetical protein